MELEPQDHDDSRRVMIALAVMMALIVAWSVFSARPTPSPSPEEGKQEEAAKPTTAAPVKPGTPAPATIAQQKPSTATPAPKPTTAAPTPKPTTAGPGPRPEVQPPQPEPELETVTKESRLLSVVFTNQEGAIEQLTLLDYFRTPSTKAAARKARREDPDANVAFYGFPLLGQAGTELSGVIADRPVAPGEEAGKGGPAPLFAPGRFQIKSKDDPRKIVFTRVFSEGTRRIEVTKTFTLPAPDDELQRHVDVEVELKNVGAEPCQLAGYRLRGPGGLAADQGPASWDQPEPSEADLKAAVSTMQGAVATGNEAGEVNVSREGISALVKEALSRSQGRVLWAAAESNYFAAILQPLVPKEARSFAWAGGSQAIGELNLDAYVDTAAISLDPGQSVVQRYRLFAGPKSRDVLASYSADYEKLLQSRWLDPLSDLMAWILRACYTVIPNYGVAIIILTFIVRGVLHPLSKKSQTSMAKMQKLQPQMKEIREKFKNDKKRQQEETMKMYREYGVNPFGGCFPMLLQIPVFIGLWRALRESIELRQAPFVFWITDLAQPDYFMHAVNILPLVSVVIMFLQQRMTPKSPDPQQQQTQKIMGYMMPLFLGFIFYNLPSGLNLYFIASMGIGVVEQKVIKRHMDRMGDLKPVVHKTGKQVKKAISTRPAKPQKRRAF